MDPKKIELLERVYNCSQIKQAAKKNWQAKTGNYFEETANRPDELAEVFFTTAAVDGSRGEEDSDCAEPFG